MKDQFKTVRSYFDRARFFRSSLCSEEKNNIYMRDDGCFADKDFSWDVIYLEAIIHKLDFRGSVKRRGSKRLLCTDVRRTWICPIPEVSLAILQLSPSVAMLEVLWGCFWYVTDYQGAVLWSSDSRCGWSTLPSDDVRARLRIPLTAWGATASWDIDLEAFLFDPELLDMQAGNI